MDRIVLVDEHDREVGTAEKLAGHRDGGRLHRAFSIVVFNRRGEMLLQRRALAKYHFGGLWSNACCGHPRPGEELAAAAHRRLGEELGFDTPLREIFTFTYSAEDARSGLTEREFDHVFRGEFDGAPQPDQAEVQELRWVAPAELARELALRPLDYAPWFREIVARLPAQA